MIKSKRYATSISRSGITFTDPLKLGAFTLSSEKEGMTMMFGVHHLHGTTAVNYTVMGDKQESAVEFMELFQNRNGGMNWQACWIEGKKRKKAFSKTMTEDPA